MKNFILIILVLCGLVFYAKAFYFQKHNIDIEVPADENEMVIEKGDGKFIAEVVSDYREDLRLFGINDNGFQAWPSTPFSYITYILVAGPYTGDTQQCELNVAGKLPYLSIVAGNEDVKRKMNEIKKSTKARRSATLIGKKIYIKKFIYKDEDRTASLDQQGKLDARNAIILSDIVEIGPEGIMADYR